MKHDLSYYAKFYPCKGCDLVMATEKLDQGYCETCKVAMIKEARWVILLVALFLVVVALLTGCEGKEPVQAAKFRPITGYYDYQKFTEANK